MQTDKILVVDDSINNLDILVELLSDYDVIDSISGVEALDILEDEIVDLILLDIMMPDMNGFEVCKLLKSNPKTRNIPVMFITSKTDESSIERAYEIGGIDYITKPFKAKELLAKVNRELQLQSLITELKNSKKKLELLASTDHLTKLYNRRYFLNVAEKSFELAKKEIANLSIVMLDIDKFKSVNDTYGHKVGDDVLIMISSMLTSQLRKGDILCRFGGEEFIILFPNTNIKESELISEKLRKEIENHPILLENNEKLSITSSFGISHINYEYDKSIDDIIARADEALYDAKNTGRNKICIK